MEVSPSVNHSLVAGRKLGQGFGISTKPWDLHCIIRLSAVWRALLEVLSRSRFESYRQSHSLFLYDGMLVVCTGYKKPKPPVASRTILLFGLHRKRGLQN